MPRFEATPIACTLAPGDFNSRLAWIAELTRDALREHRRDGLILQLTYAAEAAHRVREMVRKEQACCAFLTFDLREEPDAVRLIITAPEDARAAADTLFEQFVSGADGGNGERRLPVAARAVMEQPVPCSPTASPGREALPSTDVERPLASELRPGVSFPDWSAISSAQARAALVAMLEAVQDQMAWRDHMPAQDNVWRAILQSYGELGRAPGIADTARRAEISPHNVRALLERLAGRDLVVLEGDRLVGAYPLSDRETEHRVRVGRHVLNAMCAIDALGVGAMYCTDIAIQSRCRACGRAIRVTTRGRGEALDKVAPADAVVWVGIRYEGGCAASSLCTVIAFFCDDAQLERWRVAQRGGMPGFRLSIEEAFQVGKAIFGPVLRPAAAQAHPVASR
jgi:hypothetical protein